MSTLSMWKFRATFFALALVLAVASLPPASHAQDLEEAVIVNVPFAFADGAQHFTAGLYTIRLEDQNLLLIQGESGSGFSMAWFGEDSHPSKTTSVVFRRSGDQYFLDEVWVAGKSAHTYISPSKVEKLQIAGNKKAATTVAVAALEMPR